VTTRDIFPTVTVAITIVAVTLVTVIVVETVIKADI